MTTTPRRNVPHPLIKRTLSRIVDAPPELKALLEEVAATNGFDLDAIRTALCEMRSEYERAHEAHARDLAQYEAALRAPERVAANATAQWWEDDRATRIEATEAKIAQCVEALAEHDAFMLNAPSLLAAHETDRANVEVLRAQLAFVQNALAKAEAKLAAHDANVERVHGAAERRAVLCEAQARFEQVVSGLRVQVSPYAETLAAFPPLAPPALPQTSPIAGMLSALIDALPDADA